MRVACGSILIEFALALPILLLVIFGSIDVARFIHVHNTLEKTIFVTGDMLARHEFVSGKEIDAVFRLVDTMMFPFTDTEHYTLVISGLKNTVRHGGRGRDLEVLWQYQGMGTLPSESGIGKVSQDVTGSFEHPDLLREPQSMVITVEIFYAFEPLVYAKLLPAATLERSIVMRPLFRH